MSFINRSGIKTFEITPEYGSFMTEFVPLKPMDRYLYGGQSLASLRTIYTQISDWAKETGNQIISLPFYPKMGTQQSLENMGFGHISPEDLKQRNTLTRSSSLIDEMNGKHPRFIAFSRNILERRNKVPDLEVPIY